MVLRFSSSDYSSLVEDSFQLIAGDYELSIRANSGVGGEYAFQLLDFADAELLDLDSEVSNVITSDSKLFQVDLNAGDLLFVDAVSVNIRNNALFKLYDPFGNFVDRSSSFLDFGSVPIEFTGSYTLSVQGRLSATADNAFAFQVSKNTPQTAALVYDSVTISSINAADRLSYTFRLEEFSTLFLQGLATTGVEFRIVGERGTFVDWTELSRSAQLVDLKAGDYVLEIRNDTDFAGEVELIASLLADTNSLILNDGPVNDILNQSNPLSVYQFFGESGQQFAITPDLNLQFAGSAQASRTAENYTAGREPEDGYSGIDVVTRANVFRENAAINYILVTDEDRDNDEDNLTFETMFADLTQQNALLNVVLTSQFRDENDNRAIGVDSEGNAYIADGAGGFTRTEGGFSTSNNISFQQDYLDLAYALNGAGWDLSLLRAGGVTAESFTNAFIDVKVEEILEQTALRLIPSNVDADFEVLEPLGGLYTDVTPGQSYDFDIRVGNNGRPISYDLLLTQGQTIGSIPVFVISPYQYGASAVDADGDTLTWSLVSGPAGIGIDSATGVLSWTANDVVYGEHEITLRVDDGRGGFDEQTFTLDVNGGEAATVRGNVASDASEAAVFTIFVDQNRNGILDSGERFTETDEAGNYVFNDLGAGSYAIRQQAQPGFRQLTPELGGYEISLDPGEELVGLDFVNETVPLVNTNPLITSQPILVAVAGEAYEYVPTVEELDGDEIRFDTPLAPAGLAVNADNGTIRWTPTEDQIGIQNILLRVRDDNGGFDLQYFQIQVAEPNTAPVITSTPPTGPAGVGLPYTYSVTAVDAQQDAVQFSLSEAPDGMTIDPVSGVVNWTPASDQVGVAIVTVVALDARGLSSEQTFDLSVELNPENVAPVFLSDAPLEVRLGDRYLYRVRTFDQNGDPTTLTLAESPEGMTLNPDGLIVWQPAPNQLGDQLVRLVVEDGRGGSATQEFTIEVTTQPVNFPPEITSVPLTAAIAGEEYLFQPTAEDPNNDTLFWSLEQAPMGMTIDPLTGQIHWQPAVEDIGEHEVTVQVLDTYGAGSQLVYTLRVRAVNTPPVILTAPPTTGAVGSTYLYQVGAEDIDQDRLAFTLVGGPDGMTIDANTGLVQWTPVVGQNGTAEVEISVSDSLGASVTQVYSIEVADGQPNQLPVITSTPGFFATTGQTYTYQIVAEDPDGDELTFTLLSDQPGMTLDAATGLLEWTPTAGDLGTTLVEVVARDPALGGSIQQFSLTVLEANNAPEINSTPPTNLASGQPFRYDILATDADGDFLTYELVSGPEGFLIDGVGRTFWIPSADQIGENEIEVRVTDTRGAFATQSFTVSVAADTTAPQVVINLSENPVDVGSMVDIRVQAIDNVGVESLVLTVDGVAVPLDANGNARVQLDTVGGFTALATATDAAGNSSTDEVTIFVADPNDVEGPVVAIAIPGDGDSITAPTDVIGTVLDDTLVSYRLLLAEFGSRDFREIASGTENVDNDVLGRLDPTLLQNGSYVLRLEAFDAGGNGNVIEQGVVIDSDVKVGDFEVQFVDLVSPLAGLPIVIGRKYSSLMADVDSEVGYGWSLSFRDTQLQVTVEEASEFDKNFGFYTPYQFGTRVYVTLPGGDRQGFTFQPEAKGVLGLVLLCSSICRRPWQYQQIDCQQCESFVGGWRILFAGKWATLQPCGGRFWFQFHTYNPGRDGVFDRCR